MTGGSDAPALLGVPDVCVWNERANASRSNFEAVDQGLRELRAFELLFGGVTFIGVRQLVPNAHVSHT